MTYVPRAVSALFAAICVAGLAVTVYGMAATPNPAYVAIVCGVPALGAGVVAGIAWVAAVEERRERYSTGSDAVITCRTSDMIRPSPPSSFPKSSQARISRDTSSPTGPG